MTPIGGFDITPGMVVILTPDGHEFTVKELAPAGAAQFWRWIRSDQGDEGMVGSRFWYVQVVS